LEQAYGDEKFAWWQALQSMSNLAQLREVLMNRGMKFIALLCLLPFLPGNIALAEESGSDNELRGKFRFTASGACTESVGGFSDRPWLQALGGTTVYNETFAGTIVFDGQGRATESYKGMTMFDGPWFPNNSAVGTFVGNCELTYTMTGELSFLLTGSCRSLLPDGPAAGQTATVTGIQTEGIISRDGDMILLSGVEPVLQTISLDGGYVAKRYCIHSYTLIRSSRRP
jgi:hypothetical protein